MSFHETPAQVRVSLTFAQVAEMVPVSPAKTTERISWSALAKIAPREPR